MIPVMVPCLESSAARDRSQGSPPVFSTLRKGILSQSNQKLFEAWDKLDPVDDWERERARRIEAIQGNKNPFILAGATDTSTIPSAPIIGNRRSKVYHRPDCPGYDQVSSQNRVPFIDEAEAQAAGYRLAGNCP